MGLRKSALKCLLLSKTRFGFRLASGKINRLRALFFLSFLSAVRVGEVPVFGSGLRAVLSFSRFAFSPLQLGEMVKLSVFEVLILINICK